ncbi:MAG: YitT family protein [Chitinophagales bacterium]
MEAVSRHRKEEHSLRDDSSRYQKAKAIREFRVLSVNLIKDLFLMTVGVASAAFGLESFLVPNNFIDGGVTGISLLLTELSGWPLPLLILVINIPFIILAYHSLGLEFTIKTAIAIGGLAATVAFVHFPEVTHDNLLVAVFGGFFLGAGIGMAVRGGAVIDGTEVLAIFISKKAGTTIGDVIIAINILIFSAAAYFLGIEFALYSMITYLAASKTLDFVIEGIEEYTGVTIVSSHHEEIRQMIIHSLGRGVTIFKGRSGFGKQGERREMDIIYTVITRLEISRLNLEIEKIDPNAFVVMNSLKDTRGGMIKKRRHKH